MRDEIMENATEEELQAYYDVMSGKKVDSNLLDFLEPKTSKKQRSSTDKLKV